MNIENVLKNIKQINRCLATEFSEEISKAFREFQYDGESTVVVDKQDDLEYGNTKVFSAFIDHNNAPIIRIEVEKSRGPEKEELYYNIKNTYIK